MYTSTSTPNTYRVSLKQKDTVVGFHSCEAVIQDESCRVLLTSAAASYPTPSTYPRPGVRSLCALPGAPQAAGTHSYAAVTRPDYRWDNL